MWMDKVDLWAFMFCSTVFLSQHLGEQSCGLILSTILNQCTHVLLFSTPLTIPDSLIQLWDSTQEGENGSTAPVCVCFQSQMRGKIQKMIVFNEMLVWGLWGMFVHMNIGNLNKRFAGDCAKCKNLSKTRQCKHMGEVWSDNVENHRSGKRMRRTVYTSHCLTCSVRLLLSSVWIHALRVSSVMKIWAALANRTGASALIICTNKIELHAFKYTHRL